MSFKRHIVRAPETDRLLITIPTDLADMTDTGHLITEVHGKGETTGTTIVEIFAEKPIPMGGLTEAVGTTLVSGRIVVATGGLFLVICTATWNYAAAGAPILDREIGYELNGAGAFGQSVRYTCDSTGSSRVADQASFLVRLAAADYIKLYVQDRTGVASDVSGTLQIARLAP